MRHPERGLPVGTLTWFYRVVPVPPQLCAEPGCDLAAAYRTRTKPAYCTDHITAKLRRGGLEPLEPFAKPTAWQLTRCLKCGVEAHYRFQYVEENNDAEIRTCRACFWRDWAEMNRTGQGIHARRSPVSIAEARAHAESHGYDYLTPLTAPSLPDDPHHVRCQSCARLSAQRLGDIGFACTCLSSSKRAGVPKPASRARALFKDSGEEGVSWWDELNNPAELWETASVQARREALWVCPQCAHGFSAPIYMMAAKAECPFCKEVEAALRAAEREQLKTTMVGDVPSLLAAWADEVDPWTVPVAGGWELRAFRCPAGHNPRLTPERYLAAGCPSCRGNATRHEHESTVRLEPELVAQWHPTANTVAIEQVSDGSRRMIWWRDAVCGHEWRASPGERLRRPRWRCPECRTRLGSLAWFYPELAAQWAPDNPVSAWHVLPTGQTPFVPRWICTETSTHTWDAPLSSRVAGANCPECRISGKSAIELAYRDAAADVFGAATSGRIIRDAHFLRRLTWTVDIGLEVDGVGVAIEYDGAYWHADKLGLDTDKSRDLLAAGFLVVRLREHPLPPLDIADPRYTEFVVHSTAPQPHSVMHEIANWIPPVG